MYLLFAFNIESSTLEVILTPGPTLQEDSAVNKNKVELNQDELAVEVEDVPIQEEYQIKELALEVREEPIPEEPDVAEPWAPETEVEIPADDGLERGAFRSEKDKKKKKKKKTIRDTLNGLESAMEEKLVAEVYLDPPFETQLEVDELNPDIQSELEPPEDTLADLMTPYSKAHGQDQGHTVILKILHSSKSNDHRLQIMATLADNTLSAIFHAVNSYLDSKLPSAQEQGQRKVEVIYGAGRNGDLGLTDLKESKWPEYLDYFAQCTQFPELTMEVLDGQVKATCDAGPFTEAGQAKLDDSSRNGCASCRVLETTIKELFPGKFEEAVEDFTLYSLRRGLKSKELLEFCLAPVKTDQSVLFQIYRTFDCPCPEEWQSATPICPPMGDTASSESFLWIQERIKDCAESHTPTPCPKFDENPLPTRILDLGSSNDSYALEDPVKVLITTENMYGRYIALSHRWGDPSSMQTKLTAHTIESYQEQISYSSLPKTFQDAVKFARKIGIQYLWIDSLCIIQADRINDTSEDHKNSSIDWTREFGNMCSIYENSYLTLAACCATDSNSGLFSKPEIVHIKVDSTEGHTKGPYHIMACRNEKAHDPSKIPLLTRGWVLQEFLLSPRLLLYTDEEIVWQCRKDVTCQCIGNILRGVSDDMNSEWSDQNKHWGRLIKVRERLFANALLTQAEVLEIWVPIVEHYSAALLTYASDRLAAIDGVAQRLCRRGADDYQYGLWSDSLVIQLQWYRYDMSAEFVEDDLRSKFPTWSWASCPARVGFAWDHISQGLLAQSQCVEVIRKPQLDKEASCFQNPPRDICLRGVLVLRTLTQLVKEGRLYQDFKLSSKFAPETNLYCLRMLNLEGEFISLVVHLVRVGQAGGVFERVGMIKQYSLGDDDDFRPLWWTPSAEWVPETVTITLV
ncbi:hypothetical protein B7494_g1782 [Chlorociboria aeruginascens]|nr:hypothetical protein B7494_g1782 [Chlorociboria aeruginascens]